MANDYNVIVLDDDERNARPLVVNRRSPATSATGVRAPTAGIVVPPSTRPTVIQGAGVTRPAAQPYYAPQPYYTPAQPTVVYHQPAPFSGLGGMTTAELVDVAAQILAAIQPLPAAPTAAGDVETDVENLVMYQTALATHAKRDEQLRTLGSLLGRFLRK